MPVDTAISHAFTTLAAGGFSSNARSFEDFANPTLQWLAIIFMTCAGVNFALQYRALIGYPRDLLRDPELRTYLLIIVGASVLVTIGLYGQYDLGPSVRLALFQVVSLLTTTGYASSDFAVWPQRAQIFTKFFLQSLTGFVYLLGFRREYRHYRWW